MSWISEKALPEIRARMAPVRAWAAPRLEPARQWLIAPREPLTWAALRSKLTTLRLPSTYAGRLAVLGVIVLLLLSVLPWYATEQKDDKGAVTYPHASLINPILGGLGALVLIYAAIRQARTASAQAEIARKQAQIASDRHEAQTKADVQRRITETFSKAVEQLGSEKMEIRVGGIYILERLAGEALVGQKDELAGADLYWTVMETLTAFVREHARWKELKPDGGSIQSEETQPRPVPATDIAAVLDVIRRRPDAGREREKQRGWRFNLNATDLRGANLGSGFLKEEDLEGADLSGAHLEGTDLSYMHLEYAILTNTHLEGTNLSGAYLEGALLINTHLEYAILTDTHLEGTNLIITHLEGTDLTQAIGDAKRACQTGSSARLTGRPMRADVVAPFHP